MSDLDSRYYQIRKPEGVDRLLLKSYNKQAMQELANQVVNSQGITSVVVEKLHSMLPDVFTMDGELNVLGVAQRVKRKEKK